MLRVTALIAILALPSAAFAAHASRPLTAPEKALVEHAIRAELIDPDAARFRHNLFRTSEDQYCGLVNAKNRMGGYTGYKVFSVNFTKSGGVIKQVTDVTVVATDNGDEPGGVLGMITTSGCAAAGYRVDY
ncbi:MAG: hypothetical protein ACJ8FS_15390 [Sphingomicrobium sp.]